jgi:hypothetical protein
MSRKGHTVAGVMSAFSTPAVLAMLALKALRRASQVRRSGDVEDVNVAVHGLGVCVRLAYVRVTRQEEELRPFGVVQLRLGGHALLARGVGECRERHDVLGLIHGCGAVATQ